MELESGGVQLCLRSRFTVLVSIQKVFADHLPRLSTEHSVGSKDDRNMAPVLLKLSIQ